MTMAVVTNIWWFQGHNGLFSFILLQTLENLLNCNGSP